MLLPTTKPCSGFLREGRDDTFNLIALFDGKLFNALKRGGVIRGSIG
jgi:hypothetical protein